MSVAPSGHRLCLRCQSVGKPGIPGIRYVLGLLTVAAFATSPLVGPWAAAGLAVCCFVGAVTRPGVCARCRSGELVPLDSPAAQRLLQPGNPPR